jgi:hypothetical protein
MTLSVSTNRTRISLRVASSSSASKIVPTLSPAASTFSIVLAITTLGYCTLRTKRQIIDGASVKENHRRHIWRIRHIWRLATSSVGDQENLKRFLRRDSIPRSAALPVERLNYTLQPLPHRRPKTSAWAAFMLG